MNKLNYLKGNLICYIMSLTQCDLLECLKDKNYLFRTTAQIKYLIIHYNQITLCSIDTIPPPHRIERLCSFSVYFHLYVFNLLTSNSNMNTVLFLNIYDGLFWTSFHHEWTNNLGIHGCSLSKELNIRLFTDHNLIIAIFIFRIGYKHTAIAQLERST